MTSEDAVENIKTFLRNSQNQIEPILLESFKKAVEVLSIDASKQKMKNAEAKQFPHF